MRKDPNTESESRLIGSAEKQVDIEISQNSKVLESESFLKDYLKKLLKNYIKDNIELDSEKTDSIKKILVKEYIDEFKL